MGILPPSLPNGYGESYGRIDTTKMDRIAARIYLARSRPPKPSKFDHKSIKLYRSSDPRISGIEIPIYPIYFGETS